MKNMNKKFLRYLALACLITTPLLSTALALDLESRVVTDYIGREVTVPANIESIISLDPDATRILVAMGLGDKLVGVEKTAQSCPVLTEVFPKVTEIQDVGSISRGTLSLETIAKLDPDVVILRGLYSDTASKIQGEIGIPCICSIDSGKTVGDYLKGIEVIGNAVNQDDKASQLMDIIDDEMTYINTTVSSIPNDMRMRVLYIGPPFTSDLLRVIYNPHLCVYTAGGINVAYTSDDISPGIGPWQTVSLEQVAGWNPDMIFIHGLSYLNPDDVYDNNDWKDLKAVKDHQVYKVFAVSTGYDPAMLVLGTMQMAMIMYPDSFDFDFQDRAREICSKIYGVSELPDYMESEFGISEV